MIFGYNIDMFIKKSNFTSGVKDDDGKYKIFKDNVIRNDSN